MAKEYGAMERTTGVIETPAQLLWNIFHYLCKGKSFRGTKGALESHGIQKISDVALWKRFRKARRWLEALCKGVCFQAGFIIEKPAYLAQYIRVLLVDATKEVTCAEDMKQYLLHCCVNLFTLALGEHHLTGQEVGEKLTNFLKFMA